MRGRQGARACWGGQAWTSPVGPDVRLLKDCPACAVGGGPHLQDGLRAEIMCFPGTGTAAVRTVPGRKRRLPACTQLRPWAPSPPCSLRGGGACHCLLSGAGAAHVLVSDLVSLGGV